MTTTQILDDQILKDFRQRIKKQYSEEPEFVAMHPHPRTNDGVYEFSVNLKPDKLLRCFFWKFTPALSNGQLAMDVTTNPTDTAEMVVAGWMAARKIKDPTEKASKAKKK